MVLEAFLFDPIFYLVVSLFVLVMIYSLYSQRKAKKLVEAIEERLRHMEEKRADSSEES